MNAEARLHLSQASVQLTEAQKILCEPEDPLPSSRQTAKTYELVWSAKQLVHEQLFNLWRSR